MRSSRFFNCSLPKPSLRLRPGGTPVFRPAGERNTRKHRWLAMVHQKGRAISLGHWQLQTAKVQFSEVFRRARSEGPQYVTRQGKEAVVIVPAEEFERLTARASQPSSLVRFFAESPLAKVRVNLDHKPDFGRKVDLSAASFSIPTRSRNSSRLSPTPE